MSPGSEDFIFRKRSSLTFFLSQVRRNVVSTTGAQQMFDTYVIETRMCLTFVCIDRPLQEGNITEMPISYAGYADSHTARALELERNSNKRKKKKTISKPDAPRPAYTGLPETRVCECLATVYETQ